MSRTDYWREELDEANQRGEGFKIVCAYYGSAMFFAQVLEHGIVNALMVIDLIPKTKGKWTSEQFDSYFEGQFDKTLGKLISTLSQLATIPDELREAFDESKRRRNFLAHGFFRQRDPEIQLNRWATLVEELEGHRSYFEETDRRLDDFVGPLFAQYGMTEEWLLRAKAQYLKAIQAPKPSGSE